MVSVVSSSLFSLTIKYADRRGCRLMAVGATNYTTAAAVYLIAAAISWIRGVPLPDPSTAVLGVVTGLFYVLAFTFIIRLQGARGISVSAAAIRLSVLFPVVASIAVWGERPTGVQLAGMVMAVASLPLLGGIARPKGAALDAGGVLLTLALFVANGLVMLCLRVYDEIGRGDERVYFFALLFLTAAISSTVVWRVEGKGGQRRDILPGVALGVWNTGAGFMVVLALQSLPGTTVFPVYSSIGLVLTTLAAAAAWEERVRSYRGVGIGVAVVAAVLMNL